MSECVRSDSGMPAEKQCLHYQRRQDLVIIHQECADGTHSHPKNTSPWVPEQNTLLTQHQTEGAKILPSLKEDSLSLLMKINVFYFYLQAKRSSYDWGIMDPGRMKSGTFTHKSIKQRRKKLKNNIKPKQIPHFSNTTADFQSYCNGPSRNNK